MKIEENETLKSITGSNYYVSTTNNKVHEPEVGKNNKIALTCS